MPKEISFFLKRHEENDGMRQFSINVAAGLFAEMLEDNPDLKGKTINNFKR